MCNGSIMDKLISFALPLMVSSILQLMFNAVDIIVIGRFSGSQSLAAVGSTTALIAVFTNLFIGISLGANVLAARFYAAGRHKEMSETVHTAITLALISGILMAVIGQLFARSALELMATRMMSLICHPCICVFISWACRFSCCTTMALPYCVPSVIPKGLYFS